MRMLVQEKLPLSPGSEQPLPELTQYRIVSILVASGIWRKINRVHRSQNFCTQFLLCSHPKHNTWLNPARPSSITCSCTFHQWYSFLSIHHAACVDFKSFGLRPFILETSPCCFWLQWTAAEICTQGTLSTDPRNLC